MSRPRRIALVASLIALALAAPLATSKGRNLAWAAYTRLRGRATVDDRLAEFGTAARARLKEGFARAGAAYPPTEVTLVALKRERRLDVFARADGAWRCVRSLPILGASGEPGPKLVSGDGQVPEGVYRIESLNPNSRYHVALRVAYPNEFDVAHARSDGRDDLGGDIMVHGGTLSIGCIAMGDPGIEELFALASDAGIEHVELVVAPYDLRGWSGELPSSPKWLPELYAALAARLNELPPD